MDEQNTIKIGDDLEIIEYPSGALEIRHPKNRMSTLVITASHRSEFIGSLVDVERERLIEALEDAEVSGMWSGAISQITNVLIKPIQRHLNEQIELTEALMKRMAALEADNESLSAANTALQEQLDSA